MCKTCEKLLFLGVWIDKPISPQVRSAMEVNLKKSEKKVKVLIISLLVFIGVLLSVIMSGKGDECKCSCNFAKFKLGGELN